MEAIIKFFRNEDTNARNTVISRTLGKIAIVASTYMDKVKKDPSLPIPADQEFWRVRILKELQRGKRQGCFVVQPISKVDTSELLHLIPGMYVSHNVDGRMIVTPNTEYRGRACILPLDHKHVFAKMRDAYCVIVDVSSQPVVDASVESKPKERAPRRGNNPYA